MGTRNWKLPNFNAVGAGQVATMNLPIGPTYRAIYLRYSESGSLVNEATLKTALTEIKVKVNGTVVRVFSATEILTMLKVYGQSVAAGHIPIYFAEPWRRTEQGEDSLAWGTANVATFSLEVTIASGRTAPALEAYAVVDPLRRPLGAIKTMRRFYYGVTGTGAFQIQDLPKSTNYFGLHLFEDTAGDITDVLVEINRNKVFEMPATLATKVYADQGLTMQSGVYSVLFDHTSRLQDALPIRDNKQVAVSDFMVTATMGAANDFYIVTEEYEMPIPNPQSAA